VETITCIKGFTIPTNSNFLGVSDYGIIGRKAMLENSIEYQKYCVCARKILKLTDPCINLNYQKSHVFKR